MRFCSRAYLLLQRPPSARWARLLACKADPDLKRQAVSTITTGFAALLLAPPVRASTSRGPRALSFFRCERLRVLPLPNRQLTYITHASAQFYLPARGPPQALSAIPSPAFRSGQENPLLQ